MINSQFYVGGFESRDAAQRLRIQSVAGASSGWLLGEADNGVHVDEDTALEYSPVWAAVLIYAWAHAQTPCYVAKEIARDVYEPVEVHPLNRILSLEPNPEMTVSTFFETLSGHHETYGNDYSEIAVNNDGSLSLWPLFPDAVEPFFHKEFGLNYKVKVGPGEFTYLRRDQVLHVPAFGYTGRQGYSPVSRMRSAIGLGKSAEKSGENLHNQGLQPSGALEHPGELGDEAQARLRKQLEGKNAGLSNAHRLMILEEGMKFNPFQMDPEKAQMLETRAFQVLDVSRGWRVPAHWLSHTDASKYSNSEQAALEFVIHSLRPKLIKRSQEMTRKLLTVEEYNAGLRIWFDDSVFLQGDFLTKVQALSGAKQAGLMRTNEGRRRLNLPPVEGGDVLLEPTNNLNPLGTDKGGGNGPTNVV